MRLCRISSIFTDLTGGKSKFNSLGFYQRLVPWISLQNFFFKKFFCFTRHSPWRTTFRLRLHIRATEFRLLDFASGSSRATPFQKCKNALFPFHSAFALAGFVHFVHIHPTKIRSLGFCWSFAFWHSAPNSFSLNLLNGTQKLRFWLCLPRFKRLLTFFNGRPCYAKASHPSHFGLRPACYTKSAIINFLFIF